MKIVFDYREAGDVTTELQKMGVDLKSKRLQIGDFLISKDTAVERKTVHDFLQSIINKRIFSQLSDLKKFEKPLLIIEGNEDIYSLRDMHENAIRGALLCISLDYGIPIIKTRDQKDTALFLYLLAKREQLELKKPVASRYRRSKMNKKELQEHIVSGLPNVGPTLAKNLLKKFKTIENIFSTPDQDLIKVDKIGRKKAQEIRKIIKKKYR